MDFAFATIAETSRALRTGDIGSVQLTQAYLQRIVELDPQLNSYLTVTADCALAQAQGAQEDMRTGLDRGPMQGIPYCIKDVFDVAGMVTTFHSRLGGATALRNAAVVDRLETQGAVLLGKTALHEFATGGPTFDLPYPPARNPWNRDHHPGGSSSGAGAAVAAGLAMAGIGTDTAGSVRNPATSCGIVGIKPTYDLVSREGVFPLSFSLDHVGPLARTVEDCAIVLDVIAGSGICNQHRSFRSGIGKPVAGLRIGTLEQFHEEGGAVEEDVEAGYCTALSALVDLGVELVRVKAPSLGEFQSCGRIIQQAESYAIHRRWLAERPQDYCDISRKKLAAGSLISAADFVAAQQARRVLSERFAEATRGLDAVIVLSSFTTPCRIEDNTAITATYERHARSPFNVTGAPALSLPVGFAKNGMPVGVQLAASPFCEEMLFRVAHALEASLAVYRRHPPDFTNFGIESAKNTVLGEMDATER